jgi:hypothetical protein
MGVMEETRQVLAAQFQAALTAHAQAHGIDLTSEAKPACQ